MNELCVDLAWMDVKPVGATIGGKAAGLAALREAGFPTLPGIYESYLNVSRDQLEEHVRRCYASVYTERAIAYALKHRFKASELRMAVVIQPAIDAVAAGVAFTAEPETGCDKNALIESVFGLGAGLVSCEESPDGFVIHKKTGSVSRRILGDKGHRYAFDAGGGTRREANSAAVATRFSRLEEEIQQRFEMVGEIH